jgi:hypothetical protein
MSRAMICAGPVAVLAAFAGLTTTGARNTAASGSPAYRLVGHPIAVYHHVPSTSGGAGAYFYRVIVRLDRPVPRSGRRLLAHITLDGGGGYEGVVAAVPRDRRRPHRHCYEQILESDAQEHDIPRLDHPRPGDAAEIVMHIRRAGKDITLSRRVSLEPDRDPDPDSSALRYERRLDCVRG